ncbi:MAG: hypothetical protein L0287_08060 [Anaerolineae bacterium]|nr:hypothetical protein [Anaerolineae bacterium]MCI0609822.1 hypothetical protein [Anaerolineae bacterium]
MKTQIRSRRLPRRRLAGGAEGGRRLEQAANVEKQKDAIRIFSFRPMV